MHQTGASPQRGQQVPTTDEIAAANKSLVRRFYKEVYVDWNMTLADEVLSPQFMSHETSVAHFRSNLVRVANKLV